MQSGFVIDRDLFTRVYVTQGNEENVVIKNLHERVGVTRMIYVMRTIPTAAAVETPTTVDFTDAQGFSVSSPTSFCVGNLLSRILSDLMATFKTLRREATLSMNF